MSECQTKAGNQISLSHSLTVSHSLTLVILNNFCFHVYAQKSLSHSHTLSLSHFLTLSMSHSHSFTLSFTHSPHAEQLLFSCLCWKVTFSHSLTLTLSHSLTLTLSHSHTISLSQCLTLSFTHSRHAEQLLFWCLCSNVTLYRWKCQWFFWPPHQHHPHLLL